MVWIKLVICILVIFFSGQKVAKYGDIISERSGIGHVWMGVIAIAAITSLPELFTGISAVTLVDPPVPDLTIGNLIGANAFNMFNLALLDIYQRNGLMLAAASQAHRLTGLFSLLLVAVLAVSIFISLQFSAMPLGWIGWYTPVIILLYLFAVRQIFYFEKRHPSQEKDVTSKSDESSKRVYTIFCMSSVFIIGAGVWLATVGDEIAATTDWGQSFVGSLFLAFTTTLPEMTVSFTAMRIGAVDMAIANMIGSNLFNLTVVPVIDVIYSKGPILTNVSESHLVTAAAVIIMTTLFIIGLRFKPKRFFRLSWWNCTLIILFIASICFSFNMA